MPEISRKDKKVLIFLWPARRCVFIDFDEWTKHT